MQDMLKLNRIRLRLVDKIGHEPTLERWAQAVGTDEKALQRRLRVGHYSREYLMRSRMGIVRLVAKQYRDLGLSGEEASSGWPQSVLWYTDLSYLIYTYLQFHTIILGVSGTD